MNSAPHLLSGDRPEFERIVDEVLRGEETRQAIAATRSGLNAEQVRTLVLGSAAQIAGCAAAEYQYYVEVRQRMRQSSEQDQPNTGPGTVMSGAGWIAYAAVLTPILSGIAAVVFLPIGYALEVLNPDPSIAAPLRTAGWFFAAIAAVGILGGLLATFRTALRNPAAATADASTPGNEAVEVIAAHTAWRKAVVEQGIQPFVRQVLAAEEPFRDAREGGTSRASRLGYSSPDFTSPDEPDTTRRGPRFSSPDYTSPDFTSPDFSGPDTVNPG